MLEHLFSESTKSAFVLALFDFFYDVIVLFQLELDLDQGLVKTTFIMMI